MVILFFLTFVVVIVQDENDFSYRMIPIESMYIFRKAELTSEITPDEQVEIFDMMKRFGKRKTAADVIRENQLSISESKTRSSLLETGENGNEDDDEEDDFPGVGAGGSKGTGKSSGKRGGSNLLSGAGGVYGDAPELEPDDIEGMYAQIGAGGGEDEDMATSGRVFTVVGVEGEGEEAAADYEVGFDDDIEEAVHDPEGVYAAEGADEEDRIGGDVALGITVDEEEAHLGELGDDEADESLQKRLSELSGAKETDKTSQSTTSQTGKRDRESDQSESSTAKKTRVDMDSSDPFIVLREELRSLLVSVGGRTNMATINKHYKKRLQEGGEEFMNLLIATFKSITRRVTASDGSIEYVLKA
jgi:hypothetical protein